jgi:hypothetical protein
VIDTASRALPHLAFSNPLGRNHLRSRKVFQSSAEPTYHGPRVRDRAFGASTTTHHRRESYASILHIFNQPGFGTTQNAVQLKIHSTRFESAAVPHQNRDS